MAADQPLVGDDGTPFVMASGSPAVDSGSGCECCEGGGGQGPGCECVINVDTITVTVALTGNTYFNGTYPGIMLLNPPPADQCDWRYNWEDIDPLPTQESRISFGLVSGGGVSLTVGSTFTTGSPDLAFEYHSLTGSDADTFCLRDPLVLTDNQSTQIPLPGGSVTITAD